MFNENTPKWLNELFSHLLNMFNECITICDHEGRIVFINQAKLDLDKLQYEEVIGRTIPDVYAIPDSESYVVQCIQTKKEFRDILFQYRFRDSVKSIVSTYKPIISNDVFYGVFLHSREMFRIRESIIKESSGYDVLSGVSPSSDTVVIRTQNSQVQELVGMLTKAAFLAMPVLIYGATGTGKELAARHIHTVSLRAAKPFVAVNCAAIPESLFESLMFGSVKGAFTGSEKQKGLLEQAHGGTLFLDEVNSLNAACQAKMLRALEEGAIRRVGDDRLIPVDVRYIAATNQPASLLLNNAVLRNDLFYRLSGIYLELPPLREREGDIRHLAVYFHEYYNKTLHKNTILSEELLRFCEQYHWPGNIRQLQNCMQYAVGMADGDKTIMPADFPFYLDYVQGAQPASFSSWNLKSGLEDFERNFIMAALSKHDRNVTRTAKELGITRQNLHHKMKRYGL